MAVRGGLTNSCERREVKNKGKKGKIYLFECRVPKNSNERQERLPQGSVQKIEENNRMGKTRDLFKAIRVTKGTFHAKKGSIKDRNGMGLTEEDIIRRSGKNTQKNYKKTISMTTQITTMV